METSLGRRCSICGAVISDDNPDGIGFSCREVYQRASWKIFLSDQKRRSEYYYAKNEPIVEEFLESLSNTKFRSNFWKSFYPSISRQWQENKFVSRKQYEIIVNRLIQQGCDVDLLETTGKDAGRILYQEWFNEEITGDEMDHVVNLANKMRHEK